MPADAHDYVLAADRENTVRSYAAALRNFETVWKGLLPATVGSKLTSELQRASAAKDTAIQELRSKLDATKIEHKLAVNEAVSAVERERDSIKSNLERSELEMQLAEKALTDKYETQIRDRDAAIERLRDMKARLSTKMVGETLEQHCETEFNRIRATAFPRAYF